MTFLPLLFAMPLLGGGDPISAPAPAALDEADSVVRRYDLPAIAHLVHRYDMTRQLFPGSRTPWDHDGPEGVWSIEPDMIRDAIETFYGEELEYEGRMMWENEDGQLLVRAPEALHGRLEELLDFFAAAASSVTELQIDVVYLPMDAAGAAGPTGLVDQAAAERLLALAGGSGGAESYTIQVRGNSVAHLNLTSEHSFFGDYDVEVAENAFAFDPRRISMSSGMRVEVGAYPAPGGCNLALLVQHGTPTGPLRPYTQELAGQISADNGVHYYDGPEQLQAFSIAQRTYALNTALPDGKALVLRSHLDLNEMRDTQYMIVRRLGAAPQAMLSAELDGAGGELHMIRGYALSAPRFTFHGELAHGALSTLRMQQRDWYDDGLLVADLEHYGFDVEYEMLTASAPQLDFSDDGTWIVGRRSESADDEGDRRRGDKALAEALAALQPPSEVVNLTLAASRNGKGLSRQVTCDFPLRLGYESAVVLGVEGTRLFDYDVEIAKQSTVPDPVVGLDIDGLAFLLRADRAVDGGLDLTLRGVVNLQRDSVVFEPRGPGFGALDQRFYDRLQLDQTVHVAAGGDGSVVIGNAQGGGEAGALKLRIQVR